MKRDERKDVFQKCSGPSNPPDELAQHVSKKKKIPVGRIIPPFSSKVQNLTVFAIIYMIRIRFFGHTEKHRMVTDMYQRSNTFVGVGHRLNTKSVFGGRKSERHAATPTAIFCKRNG